MPPEPTVIAYLAGIIDSDGYITASSSTRGGRTYCGPRVGISGTRRQPHDLAASIYGGSVRTYTPTGDRSHHRDQFQWVLEGDSAAKVIEDILPFLLVKRDQAVLALELQELRVEAREAKADEDSYPWAPADYDPTLAMIALAKDIRALNVRGRPLDDAPVDDCPEMRP